MDNLLFLYYFFLFISFYIIIKPPGWAKALCTIIDFEDDNWKYWILLETILNFLIDFFFEKFAVTAVEKCWAKRNAEKIRKEIKENPNKEFKLVNYQIVNNYERVLQEEKEGKKELLK